MSKNLGVPITGKIRLGWDDKQRNYLTIGKIMEENGAAMVAMHGRTKIQKYNGTADWEAIKKLCETVQIPVIGNGDVENPEDIDRIKSYTGCDAVMIGRGAIGNPWIFSRKRKEDLSLEERLTAVRFHIQEMIEYYDEPFGLILFRKHLKKYLGDFPGAQQFLPKLLKITDLDCFIENLERMHSTTHLSLATSF